MHDTFNICQHSAKIQALCRPKATAWIFLSSLLMFCVEFVCCIKRLSFLTVSNLYSLYNKLEELRPCLDLFLKCVLGDQATNGQLRHTMSFAAVSIMHLQSVQLTRI